MAEIINILADRITSQWDHNKVKEQFKMNTNEVNMLRKHTLAGNKIVTYMGEVQPGTTERIWVKGVSTACAAELQEIQVQDGRR